MTAGTPYKKGKWKISERTCDCEQRKWQ